MFLLVCLVWVCFLGVGFCWFLFVWGWSIVFGGDSDGGLSGLVVGGVVVGVGFVFVVFMCGCRGFGVGFGVFF